MILTKQKPGMMNVATGTGGLQKLHRSYIQMTLTKKEPGIMNVSSDTGDLEMVETKL